MSFVTCDSNSMPESSENKKKVSNIEAELYLLIAKFLRTGPCRRTAELLKQELEEHQLLPKRTDWLGNEHTRSFNELDTLLSRISDDHLLKICSRIGPILDKEIPPTVPGLTSLLGVGRQSFLRTKEELEKPKCLMTNLAARKNGMPLHPSPVAQSTFSPNIAQVLTTRELSGAITSKHAFSPKIYARQQLFRRLLGHLSSVYCVLFDRTGKYIFTGADDLLVKIWSALDGRLLAALRGHSAEITDMAVNYENTLLAAGSCDKTIRVWCLHTTAPVAVLNGHTGMVTSLQFCPYPKSRNQLLISTGNDGCICFWQWNPQTNVFNPKPLKFTERNKAGAQMICSSFSPGGLFLATGSTDHNVRVYNIAGLNGPEKILERELHVDRVDSLQFSNLDCRFISGSKDGTALIWKYERQNWSSIQLKMTTKLPGEISNEAEDAKLKLRVTMVGWTLDDSKVVTAVSDYSIKVWNSYNGTLCHILKGHEDEVFVLEAHPTDSRVFLSSGHDGRIILWDLMSGSIVKNHFNLIEGQGHGAVFDCKFSPDGLMYASTDSHGHLCIFGFGSNERYKKVPEEQFFHTDYRPLIRDIHHHVLDEQTQTAPHLLPPPFLVDIDGNPYPPNLQRLVPGREHCNDSQLIPYVAVSAEGDSEILEPVRSANDGPFDRPTIDDMIERLQQEQQNQNLDSNGNGPHLSSSDSLRSPQSSRRLQSTSDDRNAQEPSFSPRTPRSQAGHSRVGLRRTGDVEGVQSVGNWQSRVSQGEPPAWVKRVVVKPINSSLSKSYYQKRLSLANYELNYFNRELKKRPVPDPSTVYENEKKVSSRQGLRTSNRSRTREENFNNMFGEEFENPDRLNMNTSTDTESEQNDELSESSDDSGSAEYSDWIEDVGLQAKPTKSKPIPPQKTSRRKRMQARYNQSTEDEETDIENGEDEEEERDEDGNSDEPSSSNQKPKKIPSQKRKMLNGKKLPERFRPPEWLTDVMPHKAPYVPQIGDEIVYFRQGHELYVQAVKRNRIYDIYMRSQPWRRINLRDQEVARIDDITFENHPPRLCCLKLVLLNPASKQADTFTVKYHDMADVIDFIVLKQNYDQAMHYDWKPGDRFRSAIDKAWWLGTIKSQKPLNPHFPDSMFQCFLVKWDNGEKEHMSPWDFEPIDNERVPDEEGGSVEIMPEERQAMMYVPDNHEWSKFGRDHDCDRLARGLTRIMELSISEPFVNPVDLNLYPSYAIVVEYPMDLGTIKARVQNRFYRRLDAVKFDVKYIAVNASKFNESGSRIVKQAKCVMDLCVKFIESPFCVDPMVIYHEMMEAKQSRSQDSQSELDVLCSESDSDGDQNTSKRLKRKKQNAMQQSSKRVRLGSKKYTSASWKQQCSELVDTIFQWDDSTPFRYPVNLNEYPKYGIFRRPARTRYQQCQISKDYRNIIDCPMDLSTVREKLSNNHYYSPIDFCKDMRLVFQNSRNYNTNKKSRIYSMTIRLSAMFEERIRGIVSDWRSAVKYEEKIRNNQYVSSRRKPLPAQEASVNVGASTSRSFTSSLPSTSRGEGSRHSINKVLNSAFLETPKHSQGTKVANGTGPKKIKVMKPHTYPKRKHIVNSIGSSLTNGVNKRTIIRHEIGKRSKRKLPEKSPKKQAEISSKREPSNTEGSRSDSNASNPSTSPESSSNEDRKWGGRPKRMRKDSNSKLNTRLKSSSLTKHKKLSSSPFVSSYRKRLRLYKGSSSSDNIVTVKKSPAKTTISPLHTRSQRLLRTRAHGPIIHSLRATTPRKYHSSTESSETDESTALRKSARNSKREPSNSPSSSSPSTSTKTQKNTSSAKSRESVSNESESSDREVRKNRMPTRTTVRQRAARSALTKPQTQNSATRQTRNCGQRTVRYGEDTDDENENDDLKMNYDSENTEPVISFSSRGRLRSLTDTEKKDSDSIEDNVFNGDTSLSETEINYSDTSTIVNGYIITEDELEEKDNATQLKGRLRPRKRNIPSSYSSYHSQPSLSLSGYMGSSRYGKYKSKKFNTFRTGMNYMKKAMQGIMTLPILYKKNIDSITTIRGRKRSRKNVARKSIMLRDGSFRPETSKASCDLHDSRSYLLQSELSFRSPLYKNFKETRAKYRRISLKTLGLNYRRKAMLCKIVLPILCVKSKFPSPQGSKKHSGRGRWRRRNRTKLRFSRNESLTRSSSSNSSFSELNIPPIPPRARGRWRAQRNRAVRSKSYRNELSSSNSNSNSSQQEFNINAENNNSCHTFTSSRRGRWRRHNYRLKNELFTANSNRSFQESNSSFHESNINAENAINKSQTFAPSTRGRYRGQKTKVTHKSILRSELLRQTNSLDCLIKDSNNSNDVDENSNKSNSVPKNSSSSNTLSKDSDSSNYLVKDSSSSNSFPKDSSSSNSLPQDSSSSNSSKDSNTSNCVLKDSNSLVEESKVETLSSNSSQTKVQSKHGYRTQNPISNILRNELINNVSNSSNNSLKQTNIKAENNNKSQTSQKSSKYNFKEIKSQRPHDETIITKAEEKYKGKRIPRYEDENIDHELVEEESDSNDSDTLTYCSKASEDTSTLYYSDDTQLSFDAQSLSTQVSKNVSEHGDLHLQDGVLTDEEVQIRNYRPRNSVYENVDVYCNNTKTSDKSSS